MSRRLMKALYLLGLAAEWAVRGRAVRRIRGSRNRERARVFLDSLEGLLLVLHPLAAQVLPVFYAFSRRLDFADYELPERAKRAGAVGGVVAYEASLWLLWRSHEDLGRNFSPTLEITEGHALVTDGVYRYVRHPMYTAHFLWAIAQVLLLHNWIVGWAGLAAMIPLYLRRMPREERMMVAEFGDEYRAYMAASGRLLPRLEAFRRK